MDTIVHGVGVGTSGSSSLQDQFYGSRDSSGGGGGGALDDTGAWSSQRNLDTQWSNRRQRATFTSYQIDRLEATFSRSRYVGTVDRAELSKQLNINENIIQVCMCVMVKKLSEFTCSVLVLRSS